MILLAVAALAGPCDPAADAPVAVEVRVGRCEPWIAAPPRRGDGPLTLSDVDRTGSGPKVAPRRTRCALDVLAVHRGDVPVRTVHAMMAVDEAHPEAAGVGRWALGGAHLLVLGYLEPGDVLEPRWDGDQPAVWRRSRAGDALVAVCGDPPARPWDAVTAEIGVQP